MEEGIGELPAPGDDESIFSAPQHVTDKRRHETAAFQEWVNEFSAQRNANSAKDDARTTDGGSEIQPTAVATPREYQIELYERAKEKNTIVVLPTGWTRLLLVEVSVH